MNTYRLLQGDALDQLRTLPAQSIHCVVTSPPYYGLRDYGTGAWAGGDPVCDHRPGNARRVGATTLSGSTATAGHQQEGYRGNCPKCGARRTDQQIGLEATPAEYVARLVAVFDEVKRVLRPDGTLWLNLGDSYNGSGGAGGDYNTGGLKDGQPRYPGRQIASLKPKDLMGIPWRVALALQDAGWWLRSDIIWAKKAPMPESVTDRPVRSHEHIFLLTQSARYYYDHIAVREPSTGQNGRAANFQRATKDLIQPGQSAAQHRLDREPTKDIGWRNQRDVWHLGPEPFAEAHFATFPTEVPRRAVLAGTSDRGCCPACGAPWQRIIEASGTGPQRPDLTTGWQPTCDCPAHQPVPCTVLDPFAGSGTTLAVALTLGRDAVGVELNPAYVPLIRQRIADAGPLLSAEVNP